MGKSGCKVERGRTSCHNSVRMTVQLNKFPYLSLPPIPSPPLPSAKGHRRPSESRKPRDKMLFLPSTPPPSTISWRPPQFVGLPCKFQFVEESKLSPSYFGPPYPSLPFFASYSSGPFSLCPLTRERLIEGGGNSSIPLLWPVLIPYLIWIIWIDTAPDHGGRPRKWARHNWINTAFANYYPVSLIKVGNFHPLFEKKDGADDVSGLDG